MLDELLRAYLRFLHRGLASGGEQLWPPAPLGAEVRDAGAELALRAHEPGRELLELAWEVAGAQRLRGQARKSFSLHLLLQWALRGLEVGI